MHAELKREYEKKLRKLVENAWEREVEWERVEAWCENFDGRVLEKEDEELYALFLLSRFIYFGKRLVREMLKSMYREHFEAPLMQRIRRNLNDSLDSSKIRAMYNQELSSTRFIGMGNPAESGAHLLYYFRQINGLPKDLFTDISGAFSVHDRDGRTQVCKREHNVTRYIFFDDLVGSGSQACEYLGGYLKKVRDDNSDVDLKFISLFSTSGGLQKLNQRSMFDGNASCLFELDETYKAFSDTTRYFNNPPNWFDIEKLREIAFSYGKILRPDMPLGFRKGELLLGFSHNTPDNTLPIFWSEGVNVIWDPVFMRFDKQYGG